MTNNLETGGRIRGRPIGDKDRNPVDYRIAAGAADAADGRGLKRETAEADRACKPAKIFGPEGSSALGWGLRHGRVSMLAEARMQ